MSSKPTRLTQRERAVAAERLAAERLERISELHAKLEEAKAALAEAKEELKQNEIEFALKGVELDFWVEQTDYYRNQLLDRWVSDARYHAEKAQNAQKALADKSGSGPSAQSGALAELP